RPTHLLPHRAWAGVKGTIQRFYRQAIGLAESHAAAIKQTVITAEKTMGIVKANRQLKAVIATKQTTRFHAIPRTRTRVSAGRRLSCHAYSPVNTRTTERKNPNALKKSQYVRLKPSASK